MPPDITTALPWINTAAMAILGVLYVMKTWKNQSSEIDAGTIGSFKRQVEALTSEVQGYKTQMHELTLLVGEQKGIIKVQKETIEKYELILQNRNPELLEVLKEIRDFMRTLQKETSFQTDLLRKNEARSTVIDKTHGELATKA